MSKKTRKPNALEDAVAFYFDSVMDCLMSHIEIDEDARIIAKFTMTPEILAQMFCNSGQFAFAREARLLEESVKVVVDQRDAWVDYGEPDSPKLLEAVISLVENAIRRHYDFARSAVRSAYDAMEGPGDMVVWSKSVGAITVTLKVDSDYIELGDVLTCDEVNYNWDTLVWLNENPSYYCTTTVCIEDDELGEIGSSALGLCSISSETYKPGFTRSVLKNYGSDLLREAVHEARTHKPKMKKEMGREVAHG